MTHSIWQSTFDSKFFISTKWFTGFLKFFSANLSFIRRFSEFHKSKQNQKFIAHVISQNNRVQIQIFRVWKLVRNIYWNLSEIFVEMIFFIVYQHFLPSLIQNTISKIFSRLTSWAEFFDSRFNVFKYNFPVFNIHRICDCKKKKLNQFFPRTFSLKYSPKCPTSDLDTRFWTWGFCPFPIFCHEGVELISHYGSLFNTPFLCENWKK